MRNKAKIEIALLGLLLLGLPPACKHTRETADESTTESNTAVPAKTAESAGFTGTYSMVSADGHPLPYAPMHQGQQGIEITSGVITLQDDGTFVSTMGYGERPANWPESRNFKGTYVQEGDALILKWEGAGRTKVTVDGRRLTMDNEGMLFVYTLHPEANAPAAETIESVETKLNALWKRVDTFAASIETLGEESDNGAQVKIKSSGHIEYMKQEGKDLWLMDLITAINIDGKTIPQRTLTVFDGTTLVVQGEVMGRANVVKMNREKDSTMVLGGKAMLDAMREKYDVELFPDEVIDTEKVYVLSFTAKPDAPVGTPPKEMRYISQETGLVIKSTQADESGGFMSSNFYRDFQLNPKLDPAHFEYVTPDGAVVTDMTTPSSPPRTGIHTEPGWVVSFPQDRSMGRLFVRGKDSRVRARFLAQAQGDITVPTDSELELFVSAEAFTDLSPLANLDRDALRYLNLRAGEVRDEDLKYVEHLRSLGRLNLVGSRVTDVGITRIANLKQLETLDIIHSGITGAGLSKLAELPLLRQLTLDESFNLTDAGLRSMGEINGLIHLSLDFNPQLTDGLAPHVARLTSLEKLFLSKTQLTDDGLALLQGLTSLQRLSLEETQITDDGLIAFQDMRSLRKLWVSDTRVTEAGAARLQKVLPGCQIVFQSDDIETPSQTVTLRVGDPAPELAIAHWVKGEPVDISDGMNKNIYVVEFWATWCPPCLTSIPHLSEIQETFKKDGVIVVGVSAEDVQTVQPFVQAQKERMEYTVAVDAERRTSNVYMKAAGQNGIPFAFIVDRTGTIAWIGHPMDGQFAKTLERLATTGDEHAHDSTVKETRIKNRPTMPSPEIATAIVSDNAETFWFPIESPDRNWK